jgi:hypothetical protein
LTQTRPAPRCGSQPPGHPSDIEVTRIGRSLRDETNFFETLKEFF